MNQLFLLLQPNGLTPYGYCYFEERVATSFATLDGNDGAPRLIATMLSDFELSYDLVVWKRGTRTSKGLIFVNEGSTLLTHDDLICIAVAESELCFAADDSGGLFRFSITDGHCCEIDRGPTSRIRELLVLH
jgi:hypothetical protein